MIKILDSKKDRDILKKIYEYEEEIFGNAAVGKYNISPFCKYGRCYCLLLENEIVSVVEVLFSLDKKAYIYGVFTNTNFRNKGYAKEILNFVINDLEKLDIKSIELTVSLNNEIGLHLYKNLGFLEVELLENEYFDNEKRYLMRKDI